MKNKKKRFAIDYVEGAARGLGKAFSAVAGYNGFYKANEIIGYDHLHQKKYSFGDRMGSGNLLPFALFNSAASVFGTIAIERAFFPTDGLHYFWEGSFGTHAAVAFAAFALVNHTAGFLALSAAKRSVEPEVSNDMPALTHQPEAPIATTKGRDGQIIELS